MAFQMVMQHLAEVRADMQEVRGDVQGVEKALAQVLPLLAKIIGLLEQQGTHPEVPMATWEHTYPELQQESAEQVEAPEESPQAAGNTRWRLARWFVKETRS
jgi:hypothetical protein